MNGNRLLPVPMLALLIIHPLCGCLGGPRTDDELEIVLYGFSVKGEVFDNKIIPAFKEYWRETFGEKVEFVTNYAGSGTITNQVITGAPAEVMILSTEWDAMKLESEGLVSTDWHGFQNNGTISISPFVIMTRDGNPRSIRDIPDLSKSGTELVWADPKTSGGACWAVFAVYGSELRRTGNDENATALLEGVLDNVISWQPSARKALSQFTLGFGDALLTYENDALFSIGEGNDIEIVYPSCTIFSEHKAVIVDRNINDRERELMEAFIEFLYTDEVQAYMVEYGFRSIYPDLNSDFPIISDPFTVEYLGGWEQAHEEIIEGAYSDIRG
ncbi:MAG: substrate-binding domain-containing protein [Thermoplasmatota archaeon]